MMTELLYRELTGEIIGAYYTVYNGLSRTYPEFIHENALVKVIGEGGVRYRRQPEYQIMYKEQLVGVQRLVRQLSTRKEIWVINQDG